MRMLTLFTAVVCLISCYSMSAYGQTSQYVGPSASTTDGAASGPLGMNDLCASYGTTAHMCTAEEFLKTAHTTGTVSAMWAREELTNCVPVAGVVWCQIVGTHDFWVNIPAKPNTSTTLLDTLQDCNKWQSSASSFTGLVVNNLPTTNGTVTSVACSETLPVACCAP